MGRPKTWAARSAIVLGAVALTLFVTDRTIGLVFGDVVKPVNALGMEAGVNELGTRLRPGFQGRYTTAEFSIWIEIDPNTGLRGPSTALRAGPRILALGDSFTFGQGVEVNEAWPAILSIARTDLPAVDVVNAGWAAPSPVGQLRYLERYDALLDPDLVIVALFVGNDVIDDLAEDAGVTRPIDQIEFQARFITQLQPRVGLAGWIRNGFDALLPNIYELTTLAIVRAQYAFGAHRGTFDVMLQDPPPAEIRAGWMRTLSAIDAIATRTASQGAQTAVVIVPFLDQVVATPARPDLTMDLPQQIVLDHCRAAQLHCFDLLPILRSGGQPGRLYYVKDGHWTPAAHRIVAREIATWLVREGLWPNRHEAIR